jgi:hypothetical protein
VNQRGPSQPQITIDPHYDVDADVIAHIREPANKDRVSADSVKANNLSRTHWTITF